MRVKFDLLKVEWDNSYTNERYFDTDEEKIEYMNSAVVKGGYIANVNFGNIDRLVLPINNADSLLLNIDSFNYVRIITDYSSEIENKTWYYFIKDFDFVSGSILKLNCELDYIMQYLRLEDIDDCFIKRIHTGFSLGNSYLSSSITEAGYIEDTMNQETIIFNKIKIFNSVYDFNNLESGYILIYFTLPKISSFTGGRERTLTYSTDENSCNTNQCLTIIPAYTLLNYTPYQFYLSDDNNISDIFSAITIFDVLSPYIIDVKYIKWLPFTYEVDEQNRIHLTNTRFGNFGAFSIKFESIDYGDGSIRIPFITNITQFELLYEYQYNISSYIDIYKKSKIIIGDFEYEYYPRNYINNFNKTIQISFTPNISGLTSVSYLKIQNQENIRSMINVSKISYIECNIHNSLPFIESSEYKWLANNKSYDRITTAIQENKAETGTLAMFGGYGVAGSEFLVRGSEANMWGRIINTTFNKLANNADIRAYLEVRDATKINEISKPNATKNIADAFYTILINNNFRIINYKISEDSKASILEDILKFGLNVNKIGTLGIAMFNTSDIELIDIGNRDYCYFECLIDIIHGNIPNFAKDKLKNIFKSGIRLWKKTIDWSIER